MMPMTGLGRTLMIMVSIVALGSAAHGQNRFKIKFGLRNLKPMKGVSLKVNAPSKALKSVLASGPRHIVNDPQGNLIQEGAKVEITKRY